MEKRLLAIQRLDKGETLKYIAAELGVGLSTVSDWKKNKNRRYLFENGFHRQFG